MQTLVIFKIIIRSYNVVISIFWNELYELYENAQIYDESKLFLNAAFKNLDKGCQNDQSTLYHFMKKICKGEFTLWLNESKF